MAPNKPSMTRRLGTLTAAFALTAIFASCGSDSKSSSTTAAAATTAAPATAAPTTAAPTTAAPATTAAGAATADLPMAASVEIKQFKFGPAEVHVAVGGTVTWTNADNQKHTATESGGFDAGAIEAGSTGTATFDTAGTFAYICSFHPFMKGTVVVGS